VCITFWRPKLSRTRASKSGFFGSKPGMACLLLVRDR
jgi:hypothetical protein